MRAVISCWTLRISEVLRSKFSPQISLLSRVSIRSARMESESPCCTIRPVSTAPTSSSRPAWPASMSPPLYLRTAFFDFTFKPGKLERLPMRLSVMPSLR